MITALWMTLATLAGEAAAAPALDYAAPDGCPTAPAFVEAVSHKLGSDAFGADQPPMRVRFFAAGKDTIGTLEHGSVSKAVQLPACQAVFDGLVAAAAETLGATPRSAPAPAPAPAPAAPAGSAQPPIGRDAYAKQFPLREATDADKPQLDACMRAWQDNPFKTADSKKFRVIEASVRVFGLGSDEVKDTVATDYPQLVLIRPTVNVMTKTTWSLLNPNGWYCFDSSVTVLAQGTVNLACGTQFADAKSATAVLSGEESRGGVTVLGSMPIRVPSDCPPP